MKERFSLTVLPKWDGLTLEALLKDELSFGKKTIHQWRMDKSILMNGDLRPWKDPLSEGDVVSFEYEASQSAPAWNNQIEVLYEDDHLLIVNKPAGLDTHPNDETDHKTLQHAVVHYLLSAGHIGYAQPVHRLDRDTTGAILFAKHPAIKPLLDQLLEKRMIKRTYIALAEGKVKSEGTISEPIGKDRHHPVRRRVSPGGQKAVTHYQCLSYDPEKNLSLVELNLETGRTHQIRVHLSFIGHPIAGDTLYGSTGKFSYQALHAKKLSLSHPFTLEQVSVEAKHPDYFG
ncbi:RluA family pseudouridine synthase [Jeotgalibacillus haloalkalitolerans]|uniref:Pseudouridine synthase n=1 Tax=Jeotgalibacillus haloalkalitolerans TaxID=3104292 RepID=A0ABU5KPD8_9BACL|nr:RluA family pseudouridine synthase [Jeotgalibacillus sp. HH7-29]MDZ5713123.1 RluA family pseudouridine synthase [Jeotgalibacillus sp. HH7-29]